jgi:D-alanyl-D-alanine carboxypeptidase
VMEVQGQSGKLYRARLTGLAEPDAREACRLLTKQNQACLVVAPGS